MWQPQTEALFDFTVIDTDAPSYSICSPEIVDIVMMGVLQTNKIFKNILSMASSCHENIYSQQDEQILTLSRAKPIITVHMLCKINSVVCCLKT